MGDEGVHINIMKKEYLLNIAIAFTIPTIVFIISLVGVKHIPAGNPIHVTKEYGMKELYKHMIFDSIQNVKDSAMTAWMNKNGLYYYVSEKSFDYNFPNSEVHNLRAYTRYAFHFRCGDRFCFDGTVCDSINVVKDHNTGLYYLWLSKSNEPYAKLGTARFDNNILFKFAHNNNYQAIALTLLVSWLLLAIIIVLYNKDEGISDSLFVIVGTSIFAFVILCYLYDSGTVDIIASYAVYTRCTILACWFACVFIWFIGLQQSFQPKEYEYKWMLGEWQNMNDKTQSLIIDNDHTAIFNKGKETFIFNFQMNNWDGFLLSSGNENFYVRRKYYKDINCDELYFVDSVFTRNGNDVKQILNKHKEDEEAFKYAMNISKKILGIKKAHSGGNLFVTLLLAAIGLFHAFSLIDSWSTSTLFGKIYVIFMIFVPLSWAAIRLIHFLQNRKLSPIKNKIMLYTEKTEVKELSPNDMEEYITYCIRYGEVSVIDFLQAKQMANGNI